jgi:hypothetical protein
MDMAIAYRVVSTSTAQMGTQCGRTRRCSGRALRDELGRILERDFVPSIIPLSTARR